MISIPGVLPAVPFRTTELLNHRVLALAPHPDDETLGCGGSLILHVRHRDPVKVVILTNGVGGDTKRQYQADEYVARRRQEARQACHAVLGVTDLEFWEYEDGALAADESTLTRLQRLLLEYQPTLVYVPSPQEYHPDHRVTAFMLYAVARRLPKELLVAFYEFNRPIHVNTLIDISGVVDEKRRACDMYATQLENYPYTDCALGLNRYRALTVSPACQYAEGFVVVPSRELREVAPHAFGTVWELPRPSITSPLVSIIVRTSDRPTFLAEALASVVAQNCSNLEVIVVNDGGPDIAGVLSRFDSLLTIRYIHHDKPRGRAGAANSGLATARGRYINFLDDDDRLYPDHVAKLVTYLEQTGQLVAYSDCEQGRYEWVDGAWRLVGERTPFMGIDYDWDRLHLANYLPIMSVMFRRSLLERVEPMDESLEFLEDWDFWLRLGACTRFQRLPGITAEYRQFTGPQYSSRQWQVAVFQKHRDYWCVENMRDLAARLLALTSRNGQLEDALERADSQRLQAETRRAETATRLAEAETHRAETATRLAEAETHRAETATRLAEAETHRAETATRLAEAETRCQGAEATLGLLQRSLPMRLSRRVRHYLPGSVVKLIRAWGHAGGLAGKASTSEALLGTLRQRLPEPTPSRLEIVGMASAAALAPAPGSLRAVLVAGEGDDQAGVDHSRALTTLHRGLARDGRLWWAGSSGGSRALRGALPEAGFVVVRRTVDGPSGAEILVARADRFIVRRYEAGDESQILKLFEVSFGARRSRERWAWAYEHGPHGRGPISEAFDAEGHLVAHYAGYPVRFYRSGPDSHDRLSALQIGDTMTARHVRHIGRGTTSLLGRTAGHFYARACEGHVAFNYGFNTATAQKFSLVFLGAKRVEPVAFAVRDARRSWPRPTLRERIGGEVRVSGVTKFDGSFDDLLRRARDSYSLLVERDARYLSWRYGTCPDSNYAIYHAHRRGQLVGWAVFRLMGDRLIWGDALVDPGCPRAAADLLERAVADHPMARTIEGWLPPRPAWWGATVIALGFEARPEPDDLALMINPFAWDPEDEFRRRLYYTKGDSDLF